MTPRTAIADCALASCAAGPLAAQPVLMSPEWARTACEAWNNHAVLTDQLVESGRVKNDKGRGFKVMHLFRKDCGAAPAAELRIALKGTRRCASTAARSRRRNWTAAPIT